VLVCGCSEPLLIKRLASRRASQPPQRQRGPCAPARRAPWPRLGQAPRFFCFCFCFCFCF